MKATFSLIVAIFNFTSCNSKLLQRNDSVIELINNAGYIGEAHQIESEDGYLLKLHRLLPMNNDLNQEKKPVLLVHGIIATSADFLVTGPDVALGYLLADNGYDVWIGNVRGSRHSMKHRNFSSESREFWTFSWHEMGFYDIPAMIDYVLNETKSPRIFYIAHSQGTTAFLVCMSTRPEYNEKIIEAHLMAPSAFRKKLPRLRTVLYGLKFLDSLKTYRYLELSRILDVQDSVSKYLCRKEKPRRLRLCLRIISFLLGIKSNEIQLDVSILPNLKRYLSPRISIMQLTHYYQNMINDRFRCFDHKEKNMIYYNSSIPPDYPLSEAVAPISLYHAELDLFASFKGVQFLAQSLPNVKNLRMMVNWNHIDFVYSKYSRDVLYYNMLESLNSSS